MLTTERHNLLLHRLEGLPGQRSNAALVLHVCDDPSATAATLGGAVLSDAFLTAKLLTLANSAYYGLSREIRDPAGAVSVLGFDVVRALALAELGGAIGESTRVPAMFWQHSARVGAASAMLASDFGLSKGEAFAIGLLHDIGRAVLLDLGASVVFGLTEDSENPAAERATLGTDHMEIGARLCELMHLPDSFVTALGNHHDEPGDDAPPSLQLLYSAHRCLDDRPDPTSGAPALHPYLASRGITIDVADRVADASMSQAVHVVAVLS